MNQRDGISKKTLAPFPGVCRCGAAVEVGQEVTFWTPLELSPGAGQSVTIVECKACERPGTLFQEEKWLLTRRAALKDARFGFIYGNFVGPGGVVSQAPMPQDLEQAWENLEQELRENHAKTRHLLAQLVQKLPRCSECGILALLAMGNTYLCEEHAQGHPNAQEVSWASELRRYGAHLER